jgi:hypothetical protein
MLFNLNFFVSNLRSESDAILRLTCISAEEQVMFTEWASPKSEDLRSRILLLRHTPKFHRLDIFEIWELVTISYSPITILEQANLVSKALTAFLTAR